MGTFSKGRGMGQASGNEGNGNGNGTGRDKVISLLPWELTVRRAATHRRAFELIDQKDDARRAIQALPELEVYYAVKEVGLEDATPLLDLLDVRQMRGILDLDAWHEHRLDVSDLMTWMVAFREASLEALHRSARALDIETLALLFRRRLLIAKKPKGEVEEADPTDPTPEWLLNPPDEIMPIVETRDGRFLLAARLYDEEDDERRVRLDEEERKAILAIVDDLYRDDDWEYIAGVLRAAQDDLSSSLEEDGYRFRNARLEDLGFPSLERALEVYAPASPPSRSTPEAPRKAPAELTLPALHAARLSHGVFRAALAVIDDPEVVRRIEADLMALSNAVLVAERVEPGDLESIRVVLHRVRAYLELALVAGVDEGMWIPTAAERLVTRHVRGLFSEGYGMTLELSTRARRVRQRGGLGGALELANEADRALLQALLRKRPMFPRCFDAASRALAEQKSATVSLDEVYGAAESELLDEVRPLETPADLAIARALLDELEALELAARALELGQVNQVLSGALDPPLSQERSVDMLLATAAARAVVSGTFTVEPITRAELVRLRERLGPTKDFAGEDLERALELQRAAAGTDALGRRTRALLTQLARALSSVVGAGEIDPRFVGVVVRRLD